MIKLTFAEIALYMNCPCYVYSDLTNRYRKDIISPDLLDAHERNSNGAFSQIIPVLRPLESMTPTELADLFNHGGAMNKMYIEKLSASLNGLHGFIANWGTFDSIPQLLAMGFDIFWWIEQQKALKAGVSYNSYLKPK